MLTIILSLIAFLIIIFCLIIKNNWIYINCQNYYYKIKTIREQKKSLVLIREINKSKKLIFELINK